MDSQGWTRFAFGEPPKHACLYKTLLIWHRYQGVMAVQWGHRHDYHMATHWRAMPRKGWIRREERLPDKDDADVYGCVLARHEFDGIKVTGWHQLARDKYLTHWRPTPAGPEKAAEIGRG